MTASPAQNRHSRSHYLIYDAHQEEIVFSLGEEVSDFFQDIANDVAWYNEIMKLPRFGQDHCGGIEYQKVPGEGNYFLQYTRTRDIEEATFVLTRPPNNNELVLPWVRGATGPDGQIFRMTKECKASDLRPAQEGGSFSFNGRLFAGKVLAEITNRTLATRGMVSTGMNAATASKVATGHQSRSAMFMPHLSFVVLAQDLRRFLSDKQAKELSIHITSDGKKGYGRIIPDCICEGDG